MLIQHRQKENHGVFFVEEDGDVFAEMRYSHAPGGPMIIEHTEVDEELRGRNVGYELVHAAVEYARTHNFKISPVCTFAKSVFDHKVDFQDVLT